MTDPWELNETDSRSLDSKSIFIVFCEDGAVEPAYLRSMSTKKVEITCIPDAGQHHHNVDKATEYLRDQGMLEMRNGREVLRNQEGIQIWCMFDRDKDNTKDDGKSTAFNDSIVSATDRGIHVAWSNDDFELWILMHFEDVDQKNVEYQHRSKYYERLTELLKTELVEDSDGSRIVGSPNFSYKDFMKKENRFVRFTLQLLKGKTGIALQRAKSLEAFHNASSKAFHEKSPCTMVHHLYAAILDAGGREI
ncbi:MAG: hypothetical protein RLZZ519_1692 [Bacteroidota bacterium]